MGPQVALSFPAVDNWADNLADYTIGWQNCVRTTFGHPDKQAEDDDEVLVLLNYVTDEVGPAPLVSALSETPSEDESEF